MLTSDNYVDKVTAEIQGVCRVAGGHPRQIAIEHNEPAMSLSRLLGMCYY
jgi:hypothetical protein